MVSGQNSSTVSQGLLGACGSDTRSPLLTAWTKVKIFTPEPGALQTRPLNVGKNLKLRTPSFVDFRIFTAAMGSGKMLPETIHAMT